jgi:nucleoside-diphosphate-sugar epimerase
MLNYRDPDWLGQAKRLTGFETGQLAKAAGVNRSILQRIANGDGATMRTFIKIDDAVRAALAASA